MAVRQSARRSPGNSLREIDLPDNVHKPLAEVPAEANLRDNVYVAEILCASLRWLPTPLALFLKNERSDVLGNVKTTS